MASVDSFASSSSSVNANKVLAALGDAPPTAATLSVAAADAAAAAAVGLHREGVSGLLHSLANFVDHLLGVWTDGFRSLLDQSVAPGVDARWEHADRIVERLCDADLDVVGEQLDEARGDGVRDVGQTLDGCVDVRGILLGQWRLESVEVGSGTVDAIVELRREVVDRWQRRRGDQTSVLMAATH